MSEQQRPFEIAMKALWDARDKMLEKCGKIGEPAVYLPIGEISTFVNDGGEVQAIMGMTQFICLADRVLRQS